MTVKLSVTLPDSDVAYLDSLVARGWARSRSAALHLAVCALRERHLVDDCKAAILEWEADAETAALWDSISGDGVDGDNPYDSPIERVNKIIPG